MPEDSLPIVRNVLDGGKFYGIYKYFYFIF